MSNRKRMWSFISGSVGARSLSRALGILRIRHNNSIFVGRGGDVVLNWGSSQNNVGDVTWINHPDSVAVAVNKLSCFTKLDEDCVNIPPYSESKGVAEGWVEDGHQVVVRTLLSSTKGKGIILATEQEDIVDAPLYVKYIPKEREFRVHIVDGRVVDVQQKKIRRGSTNNNFQIRNHSNGWVFCREDIEVPEDVLEQSLLSIKSLSLDFGAVDVVYNTYQEKAYVLEINTAPGLVGTTLVLYTEALRELIQNIHRT